MHKIQELFLVLQQFFLSSSSQQRILGVLGLTGVTAFCLGLLGLFSASSATISSVPSNEGVSEVVTPTEATSPGSGFYIDVNGAVNKPGIYFFNTAPRVAQAIEKAGGVSGQADSLYIAETLNLAKVLSDGEKVFLPFKGTGNSSQKDVHSSKNNLVSINSGSLSELDALPGIGEKRAQQIIDGRPYSDISELKTKAGLSESLLSELSTVISL